MDILSYMKAKKAAKDIVNNLKIIQENNETINKLEAELDAVPTTSEVNQTVSTAVSEANKINQITKLGVVASSTTPYVVNIDIPTTYDFKLKPVEVLYLVRTTGMDPITVLCEFNNSDITSFENVDNNVIFDGKMYLRTSFDITNTTYENVNNGKQFSFSINKDNFKKIFGVEV